MPPATANVRHAPAFHDIPAPRNAGMLGDQPFQVRATDDPNRAMRPPKPVPAPRTLLLVHGQTGAQESMRSSITTSLASTPDSGLPPSIPRRATSTASYPDELNPFDDTSSMDSLNPFNDVFNNAASVSYPESLNPFDEVDDEEGQNAVGSLTVDTPTAGSLPVQRVNTPIHIRNVSVPPVRISAVAAIPASADQNPDIRDAREALRQVLADAAPRAAGLPLKTKPAGSAALRAIARKQQRRAPDSLHYSAQEFYRAVLALSPKAGNAAIRQAALKLAAFAQRAAVEGYDAVDSNLVKRVLNQSLHSLPTQTLCELAHLNEHGNGTGEKILREAGNLLGADKQSHKPAVEQARKEHAVASVLLGLTAEYCRDNGRTKSWNHQVLIALEAARGGQHRELDGALREMWHNDLLLGEMDQPRVARLHAMIQGLTPQQRNALATMLGMPGQANATSDRFEDFMNNHLSDFEGHEPIRNELKRFVDDLRAASQATPRQTASILSAVSGSHGPSGAGSGRGDAAEATGYPPVIAPASTIGTRFAKTGRQVSQVFGRIRTTLGGKQPARDAAREQIELAVRTLIGGGGLSSGQVGALKSVDDRLKTKLRDGSTSFQRAIIQNIVSKLSPEKAESLMANLATVRSGLQSSTPQDPTLKKFYDMLHERLEREVGIRRCAAALVQVSEALAGSRYWEKLVNALNPLAGSRRPEKLLNALDRLADAQGLMLRHQSDLEFCGEALDRLGEQARVALRKRLKGRVGVERLMHGIHDAMWDKPAAALQFRRKQLEVLLAAASGRS